MLPIGSNSHLDCQLALLGSEIANCAGQTAGQSIYEGSFAVIVAPIVRFCTGQLDRSFGLQRNWYSLQEQLDDSLDPVELYTVLVQAGI